MIAHFKSSLAFISRIAPSVSRFMQNTSGALTVPSFRRLPLFISTRILSHPVLLNLLLSYKTVSGFVAFAVTVTLLQLSFPSLVFQVALCRMRFTQAASVLNISQSTISCQALCSFFLPFFSLFLRFFYCFFLYSV